MAKVIDYQIGQTTAPSTNSLSIDFASGLSNDLSLLAIPVLFENGDAPSTFTVEGVAGAIAGSYDTNPNMSICHYKNAPASSDTTYLWTFPSGGGEHYAGLVSVAGYNHAAPLGTPVFAHGGSTDISASVTTVPGQLVMAFVDRGGTSAAAFTMDAPGTLLVQGGVSALRVCMGKQIATTTTTTVHFRQAFGNIWTLGLVAVNTSGGSSQAIWMG